MNKHLKVSESVNECNDVGNAKAGRQAGNSFLTCYVVV